MAIVDVGTAFLHADNDEEILMKLRGKIVELLVQLEPTMYRKYITVGSNREPILYVRLLKALYGLLRSALPFYKNLRGDPEKKWVLRLTRTSIGGRSFSSFICVDCC